MEHTKPKIALMSYAMDNRKAKGIALYTRKLIEGLIENNNLEIYLVHYDKVSDPLYQKAKEIIMPRVVLPFGSHFVSQMLFFWKYRKESFDIIHWFHPRLYPFYWFAPAKKIIVTMHGAGDITAPHSFVFSRSMFNFILKYFHSHIDIAIVDSESAKSAVVKYYNFSSDHIESIYLGGSEDYKPLEKVKVKELVLKYGIKAPYILDISRLQPHKNVVRLIEAYDLLRKNNPNRSEKLVIVGAPTQVNIEEHKLAKKSEFSSDITFIEYVDERDLNAVYSGSEVFVFPSLDEGFGLPVLEAMASGVPVVTSNTTSLPEIGGDAVVKINPYNVQEIANALEQVLKNQDLREKTINSGLLRASEFTWEKTVKLTAELYSKILNNNGKA